MPIEAKTRAAGIVGKLTEAAGDRRELVTRTGRDGVAFVLLALLLATPVAQAETPAWQPVEQITAAAEVFLRSRTGEFAGNTTVQAGNIDSRHRLPLCDAPLSAFLRSGADIKARTIVGVRCSGSRPWKVYVPVDVIVTANVLVARQSLIKGHQLAAEDLIAVQRDVSRLRTGYISDPARVVGQRLKTQLVAGKILKPSMLEVDIAIRRGQTVTLTVGSGEFSITMSGKALMDGAINQRIRVENSHSGRVVEGIVRSREHVEVLISSNNAFFHAEPKVSPQMADTRFSNNDR